ncbi:MAG: hypothetical protein IPI67_21145 [Myxococcales bacterium]|nr:hypothetical protein [Myxococcales bacterium]
MKLSLGLAPFFLLALGACTSLAPYGGIMAQPGAGSAPAPGGASTQEPSSPAAGTPVAATPSTGGSAQPSAPSSVSVTIKSSCSKTVKVFYGDKPKFGSGTYSSASSNSRQSHSFRPGDQFWIVDDKENGVANVQVGADSREIEISGSCTQLALR